MSYTFRADPQGTTFWHAHYHEENEDGIYGPFIVEDRPNSFPFHYDQDIIIMMTDAYNLTSWQEDAVLGSIAVSAIAAGQPIYDPAPDQNFLCTYDETQNPPTPSCSSTTDGRGFNLNFQSGMTYRLRLICSSELAPFLFSIDEHELQVVSVDFTPLDGTTWVQSVPLMTGQRYDVLVRAKDNVTSGAKFWARATMQNQCVAAGPTNVTSDIRGVITYGQTTSSTLPTSTSWNATNPNCVDLDQLKPLRNSSQSDVTPAMTIFLNYTLPAIVNGLPEILINGNQYNVSDFSYPTLFGFNENASWRPTVPGEQRNLFYVPDSLLGKEIRVILRSLPRADTRNHPFHHHGGGFKVLASGTSQIAQADLDNITADDVLSAVERDTVVVQKDGWVVTQFTADNPGVWAFHCHIGFHLAHGMIGQFVVGPNAIASDFVISAELKSMCSSSN